MSASFFSSMQKFINLKDYLNFKIIEFRFFMKKSYLNINKHSNLIKSLFNNKEKRIERNIHFENQIKTRTLSLIYFGNTY